jgi:hypothetical protein
MSATSTCRTPSCTRGRAGDGVAPHLAGVAPRAAHGPPGVALAGAGGLVDRGARRHPLEGREGGRKPADRAGGDLSAAGGVGSRADDSHSAGAAAERHDRLVNADRDARRGRKHPLPKFEYKICGS